MTEAAQFVGPPTIEQVQEELEREMVRVGIERFERSTANLEESGMASKTSYGVSFIRTVLLDCAALIQERMEAAKKGAIVHGKNWHLIAELEPESAAFIALRSVLDISSKVGNLSDIVREIGKKVQDEVRFRRFEREDKARMGRVLRHINSNGSQDYRYKHRVLTYNMTHDMHGQATGTPLYEWTPSEVIHVGAALLEAVIASTGHFQKVTLKKGKRQENVLQMSDELLAWIADYKDRMGIMYPAFLPCVVEPMDWQRGEQGRYFGGYYTPEAQACLLMVINKGKNGKKPIKALQDADLSRVCDALNHLQKTPWRINKRVLEVIKEVARLNLGTGMPKTAKLDPPPFPFAETWKKEHATEKELEEFAEWKHFASLTYTAERERVSKAILLSRIINIADRYKHLDALYFVWRCDFRGRMYTAAHGLSPQSNDVAKSLLHFKEGMPLDSEQAVFWWKVHGGNCFGVDKLSYTERVRWVNENEQYILETAADPVAMREFWGGTDKPYQFLAWCFEYAQWKERGDRFVSRLPIGLDGSCNGLQHFSAMLRDSVGGAAVNLTPSDRPKDIYAAVAALAVKKLSEINDERKPIAQAWLAFGIDRSTVKRSVMTLPYGATRTSCRDYLFQHYLEKKSKENLFDSTGATVISAINLLTEVVWSSIGEVVIAARAAMDWLRDVASIVSKANLPITFTAPSGFVVHQAIKKVKVKKVMTILCGRTDIPVATPDEDSIDSQRQRNGISPNFVHSCDASHLVSTILKAREEGITSISAIHDDFGTHAANTALFHNLIRESFVEQYSIDVLQKFKDEIESSTGLILPPVPASGDLVLESVLDSGYFFG